MAMPVVLVFPPVEKLAEPSQSDRPFWSLRFRMTVTPALIMWLCLMIVKLSIIWMSVVGEISTKLEPRRLAKFEIAMFGMPPLPFQLVALKIVGDVKP